MLTRKLRIATSLNHVGHAVAPMIAVEKGFFSGEGFHNYELLLEGLIPAFVEKVALSASMKERGVQIVLAAMIPSVLALNSRGEDLYIVSGWRFAPLSDCYARPGIKSFADLKGKKIGVRSVGATGPTHMFLWKELLKAGLDPEKDVKWVEDRIFTYHRTRDHVDALRDGRVDCVMSRPPFAEELEKMGCTLLLSPRELFPRGRPMSVIAARRSMIEEHGRELRAFLRAILHAFWFERDPSNYPYIADLEKRLRSASPDEDERALRMHTSAEELAQRPLPVDGLVPLEALRQIAEEMKEAGEIAPDYSMEAALRDEAIKDAFQELRSRKELEPQWEGIRRAVEKNGY